MKHLKTIVVLFICICCMISCNNDDETVSKQYPNDMIYRWDGSVRQTDFGNSPETTLTCNIKENGVLEVLNNNQPNIIRDWCMIGNILYVRT